MQVICFLMHLLTLFIQFQQNLVLLQSIRENLLPEDLRKSFQKSAICRLSSFRFFPVSFHLKQATNAPASL